jgi:hypothetical protein
LKADQAARPTFVPAWIRFFIPPSVHAAAAPGARRRIDVSLTRH